jgi:hypothetical protein
MNKAFVREPEVSEPRCPEPGGCGAIGLPVTVRTLRAQVSEDATHGFSESAYYCPSPSCDIAYFDAWGQIVPRSELRRLIYPKSDTGPVCACFDVPADEIVREAVAGRKERVRELLQQAESAEARCETESPCGVSCVAEIRRIFLEHFTPE